MSVMERKERELAARLAECPADAVEILRSKLSSTDAPSVLAAIKVAAKRKEACVVCDLLSLLESDLIVECTAFDFQSSGHQEIAVAAAEALEQIGAPPPFDRVAALLAGTKRLMVPEACYDQGAYIGDYSSAMIVPSALAARIANLLGDDAFKLTAEIAQQTRDPDMMNARFAHWGMNALAEMARGKPADITAPFFAALEVLGSSDAKRWIASARK
jgi:hypothetical protein